MMQYNEYDFWMQEIIITYSNSMKRYHLKTILNVKLGSLTYSTPTGRFALQGT